MISKLNNEAISLDDSTTSNQSTEVFNRLNGRQFLKKVPVLPASKSNNLFQTCKVCFTAEHKHDRCQNLPKCKRFGRESHFECSVSRVSLCVGPCFEIYHIQKKLHSILY